MFALRDGVIDNKCINGGICCDEKAAFAVVLRETETQAENPSNIVYRCRLETPLLPADTGLQRPASDQGLKKPQLRIALGASRRPVRQTVSFDIFVFSAVLTAQISSRGLEAAAGRR
jgi:hypothetical protein